MSSIAFIGLGNMGGPMAANLVSAGHSVRAFDLSEAACAVAKQAGCTVATSAAEAAGGADIVFSMLPSGAIVEAVYLGDDGLLASLPNTTLVIDSSTIAAESARTVWAAADALGIRMIDAPVSGGVAAATASALSNPWALNSAASVGPTPEISVSAVIAVSFVKSRGRLRPPS